MPRVFNEIRARYLTPQGWRICAQWQPGAPAMAYSLAEALSLADDAERSHDHELATAIRDAVIEANVREKTLRRITGGIRPNHSTWRSEADRIAKSEVFNFSAATRLTVEINRNAADTQLKERTAEALPSLQSVTAGELDPFRQTVARNRFNAIRHLLHSSI
jgi:hypothetical protein